MFTLCSNIRNKIVFVKGFLFYRHSPNAEHFRGIHLKNLTTENTERI